MAGKRDQSSESVCGTGALAILRPSAGRIQSLQVASATLPNPKQFESLLRSGQSSNASTMQVSFNRLYGSVPAPTDASLPQTKSRRCR